MASKLGQPRRPASYDDETLRRFFILTPADLAVVQTAPVDQNRLGMALLLVWARVERVLVSDPATLPETVIAYVSQQLGLTPAALHGYGHRPATQSAHAGLVCTHLGVRPFSAGRRRPACLPGRQGRAYRE